MKRPKDDGMVVGVDPSVDGRDCTIYTAWCPFTMRWVQYRDDQQGGSMRTEQVADMLIRGVLAWKDSVKKGQEDMRLPLSAKQEEWIAHYFDWLKANHAIMNNRLFTLEEMEWMREDKKIKVIKSIRTRLGLGLAEAKNYCEKNAPEGMWVMRR